MVEGQAGEWAEEATGMPLAAQAYDDFEPEPLPMITIEDYGTEAEAGAAARVLIEHGIGASVEFIEADPPDVVDAAPRAETDAGAESDTGAVGPEADPAEVDGPERNLEDIYRLVVLDHEGRRALEVLGFVDPEIRPEANPVEPMKPVKAKMPWKGVLVIYLIALIVLPGLAFLLTYTLMR